MDDEIALLEDTAYKYGMLRGSLSSYGALKAGWHPENPDSLPISRDSIEAAGTLLDCIAAAGVVLPIAQPTAEGGVILGWELGPLSISVGFDRAGSEACLKARRATDGASAEVRLPASHTADITRRVSSTLAKA